MKIKPSELRIDYDFEGLDEKNIEKDPFRLFDMWFEEAVNKNVFEPNAMTLATVDERGKPAARIVLLKDVSRGGFVFYTNYQSRKGKHLEKNHFASLVFWWNILARQVRIEGIIEKLTSEESDKYFSSRPKGNQIGAVISNQSSYIPNHSYLLKKYHEAVEKYHDCKVPRPENWGGYRLIPDRIEFWQGRQNRLHDRLLFTRCVKSEWKIERLAP